MKMKTITKTFHDVHVSEDGENWYKRRSFEGTPAGLAQAKKEAMSVRSSRHVRVAHITRMTNVLSAWENTLVLSKQQIADLLAKGNAACQGIQGLSCNEGFSIGFGATDIEHGPTRVTISFSSATVLGKQPSKKLDPTGWRKWEEDSPVLRAAALDTARERLTAAGVSTLRRTYELELKPS